MWVGGYWPHTYHKKSFHSRHHRSKIFTSTHQKIFCCTRQIIITYAICNTYIYVCSSFSTCLVFFVYSTKILLIAHTAKIVFLRDFTFLVVNVGGGISIYSIVPHPVCVRKHAKYSATFGSYGNHHHGNKVFLLLEYTEGLGALSQHVDRVAITTVCGHLY